MLNRTIVLVLAGALAATNVAAQQPDTSKVKASAGEVVLRTARKIQVVEQIDSTKAKPLGNVDVIDLIGEKYSDPHTVKTNTLGVAALESFTSVNDTMIVQVKSVGYKPIWFYAHASDTATLVISLERNAQLLATTNINSKLNMFADPGLREGIDARCMQVRTTCLAGDSIAKYSARTLQDVLQQVSGFHFNCSNRPMKGASYAARCGLMDSALGNERCDPSFYVDGLPTSEGKLLLTDKSPIKLVDLQTVEVYLPAYPRPSRWSGNDHNCGAVALWTRQVSSAVIK